MERLIEIKEIATSLGAIDIYETYQRRIMELNTDYFRVGIVGGINSGKTTIIKELTGAKLPIYGYASGVSFEVHYGDKEKYYLSGKTLERCPDITKMTQGENILVEYPSEWLNTKSLILREKVEKNYATGERKADFCVSDMDVCLYLIDGLMAYTNNDALIIDSLFRLGIPTLVVISKMDYLKNDDGIQNDSSIVYVTNYVKEHLKSKTNVSLFSGHAGHSLSQMIPSIRKELENIIASCNKDEVRTAQGNLFLVDAIASLFGKAEELKKEIEAKEKLADRNTEDKKNKLSSLEGEWARIELELTKKRQECEYHIRKRLEEKKNDITRRISHELDTINDIKVFWERDLAYRIDESLRAESQNISQLINTDIVNTICWLQEVLLKTFKRRSFVTPNISLTTDDNTVVLDNIELADNKKLKIVTRVGTAATVIAAGTLLASSGVAGVVMAISMVSGIGAEWFIGKKSKESRDKVKSLLPLIIDQAILNYVDKVSTSLKDSYAEIITNLRNSQKQWKTDIEKEIEEEDKIAHYNSGREKYNMIMSQLNKLSNRLLD